MPFTLKNQAYRISSGGSRIAERIGTTIFWLTIGLAPLFIYIFHLSFKTLDGRNFANALLSFIWICSAYSIKKFTHGETVLDSVKSREGTPTYMLDSLSPNTWKRWREAVIYFLTWTFLFSLYLFIAVRVYLN
jgi:hypothetical protein